MICSKDFLERLLNDEAQFVYTMLYLMIYCKDFLKRCPSITGFSMMGDYSSSSIKN